MGIGDRGKQISEKMSEKMSEKQRERVKMLAETVEKQLVCRMIRW